MRITQRLVTSSQPGERPIEYRDSSIPGFILRVQPSGVKSYIVEWARGRRKTIGRATVLTLEQARRQARAILADPDATVGRPVDIEFRAVLKKHYGPWVKENRKDGVATMKRLSHCFGEYGTRKLSKLDAMTIERWQTAKLKGGRAASTVNRDIAALKAALSKAVEWGMLPAHPLATVKPIRLADEGRVRWLDADEEKRLRNVLDKREQEMIEARQRGNE